MSGFSASFLEIEPRELVGHLLRESGQQNRDSINPAEILQFLDLEYLAFDFSRELPSDAQQTVGGAKPRALISFNDRLVATDSSLDNRRARFSVLHEVGHYVLPHHQHALYVCDDIGLSFSTRLTFEREANEFAADLLFLGDRFSVDSNSRSICAGTVKELAERYNATFETTSRRIAERSFRPCMLVVFMKEPSIANIDVDQSQSWRVRYCIASPTFRATYFESVSGVVPADVVSTLTDCGFLDIADSVIRDVPIEVPNAEFTHTFRAEFFSNSYSIFCFLTPFELKS